VVIDRKLDRDVDVHVYPHLSNPRGIYTRTPLRCRFQARKTGTPASTMR
jgi:hypothetical protein